MSLGDYDAVCASPLPGGVRLGLRLDTAGQLCEIDFLPAGTLLKTASNPIAAAIQAFFAGTDARLVLAPSGTAFQQRVWASLRAIPRGQTRRYGELADELGSSARAVAGACRANPIPLLIPCHRVVAANGIGGYGGEVAGANIELKQWLLRHEQDD